MAQGKSGLTRGGHLEGEIWAEFHDDPVRLAKVVETIRAGITEAERLGVTYGAVEVDDGADGAEATEGRITTVMHQRRERSRKIVESKKAAALKALGILRCEACAMDFASRYGARGAGYIECHHTRPVETLGDGTPTKLADLALLCANCHRMVHAKRPWLTMDELRACLVRT
jgi:5-methylcytosine-specific restriction protein A